ncbi:MAG: DUF3606 domain-containing protein [Variovorax sp.]|nr:MAG: DUF3606 domain-containing protein [Variovorax sp.]
MTSNGNTPSTATERIDIQSDQSLADWSKRLDTTSEQLKTAVAEVGDAATDVELYLKGTRSSTNDTRVDNAG